MNNYFLITALMMVYLSYSQSVAQQKTDQIKTVSKHQDTLSFVVFSITDQSNAEQFLKFKEKYNVRIKFETCAVDVSLFKKARKNNMDLAVFLTEKYGTSWLKDLPCNLVGVNAEQ